jgi:hypothetical protein
MVVPPAQAQEPRSNPPSGACVNTPPKKKGPGLGALFGAAKSLGVGEMLAAQVPQTGYGAGNDVGDQLKAAVTRKAVDAAVSAASQAAAQSTEQQARTEEPPTAVRPCAQRASAR